MPLTETAICMFLETVKSMLDSNALVGAVFLDLKKAFDSVNHQVLLSRLTRFNFSEHAMHWLASYLSGRKQYVRKTSDFIRELENADVFILQETWCRGDVSTGCPSGYIEIMSPSTKLKGVTQGRDSGGMLIWYKANLVQYIKLIKKREFSILIKIKKDLITTDKDVFLCAAYIPPSQSPYFNEHSFSILEDEISYFQAQGSVLICGDLNARTGTEPDFISTQGDKHIPGPPPFTPPQK